MAETKDTMTYYPIKVNDKWDMEGWVGFSCESEYVPDSEAVNGRRQVITIPGVCYLPEYIHDLRTLECDRYLIKGIDVSKESFASDEDMIEYTFTARSFTVKR